MQVFETPNAHAFMLKMLRFFKKLPFKFQSHNFRTTTLTDLYNETKDIITVQRFAGHRSIKTTQGYIKKDQLKVNKQVAAMLRSRK